MSAENEVSDGQRGFRNNLAQLKALIKGKPRIRRAVRVTQEEREMADLVLRGAR